MEMATFLVPSTALPALIGSKGTRIKDINHTSGATVRFDTTQTKATTTTYIRGSLQQIHTAIALLKMAVLHSEAAYTRPPPASYSVTKQAQAASDLYMCTQEVETVRQDSPSLGLSSDIPGSDIAEKAAKCVKSSFLSSSAAPHQWGDRDHLPASSSHHRAGV